VTPTWTQSRRACASCLERTPDERAQLGRNAVGSSWTTIPGTVRRSVLASGLQMAPRWRDRPPDVVVS